MLGENDIPPQASQDNRDNILVILGHFGNGVNHHGNGIDNKRKLGQSFLNETFLRPVNPLVDCLLK